jgi:hypothetical protein
MNLIHALIHTISGIILHHIDEFDERLSLTNREKTFAVDFDVPEQFQEVRHEMPVFVLQVEGVVLTRVLDFDVETHQARHQVALKGGKGRYMGECLENIGG